MNKEPITLHLETFNNEEYILADECIEAIGLHRRTNAELRQTIEEKDKEIERLNSIIKYTDSWIDRTIEIIKQQPSEDDTWILERLNGIKQCLKGVDKE